MAPLVAMQAGFNDKRLATLDALERVRNHAQWKAIRACAQSPSILVRGATLRPYAKRPEVARLLLERVPRASIKSSSKNRLVWVANYAVVESVVRKNETAKLKDCGVFRWTTGEGASQLTVEPGISALPDEEGKLVTFASDETPRVVTCLFADLHRYMLIYEALKVLSQSCRVPTGASAALRAASEEYMQCSACVARTRGPGGEHGGGDIRRRSGTEPSHGGRGQTPRQAFH